MCALNLIYCFNNACRIFLRRHSTPNERIQLLLVAFILWCLNISIINKINCHIFYISSTTVFLTGQMLNQFHVKQQQKKISFGALFNKNSEFYVNPMFMSKTSKKKSDSIFIPFSVIIPKRVQNFQNNHYDARVNRKWLSLLLYSCMCPFLQLLVMHPRNCSIQNRIGIVNGFLNRDFRIACTG